MRLRARRDGGEHDLGGRHGEVVAVVLADAEEVDADRIGQHRFVDNVADHLVVGHSGALGIDRHVTERVEPEFDCRHLLRLALRSHGQCNHRVWRDIPRTGSCPRYDVF